MRAFGRKRPQRRTRAESTTEYRQDIAPKVRYVGSPEHKDTPSFVGAIRPRADATICPREFADQQSEVERWLKDAVKAGNIGPPWEGGFPRYVWYRHEDGTIFEGRLVNRDQGQYKGYPLHEQEHPDWM